MTDDQLPPCDPPSLAIVGGTRYSFDSTTVTMYAEEITNTNASLCISEPLALSLWAHIGSDDSSFYYAGTAELGRLRSDHHFAEPSVSGPRQSIPDGCYSITMNLVNNTEPNHRYDYSSFSKKLIVQGRDWELEASCDSDDPDDDGNSGNGGGGSGSGSGLVGTWRTDSPLDDDYILRVFNADGSGQYLESSGCSAPFDWSATGATDGELEVVYGQARCNSGTYNYGTWSGWYRIEGNTVYWSWDYPGIRQ